ncbi:hypothetical protein SAMN04487914_13341 [Arthrobacter sp. ok909]|nr:hypothetical protein SAMN04487914_13341 [Arthrobacter sp. ok909]
MIIHMRHMGISGKIAIGAFLAALALLVLTGITLNETVFVWFLGASAAAYVACVAEVVIRRRHKTLVASGAGSILFIAFGIAFLRQWGLAFNPDPNALSTRVDSAHPDLYFYLAGAAGAVTLLQLFAGTALPGRSRGRRVPGQAPRRRPAPVSRGAGARTASPRPSASRTTGRGTTARPAAARPAAKSAAKAPARVPSVKSPAAKSPVRSPAARTPAKSPSAKAPARNSARR